MTKQIELESLTDNKRYLVPIEHIIDKKETWFQIGQKTGTYFEVSDDYKDRAEEYRKQTSFIGGSFENRVKKTLVRFTTPSFEIIEGITNLKPEEII